MGHSAIGTRIFGGGIFGGGILGLGLSPCNPAEIGGGAPRGIVAIFFRKGGRRSTANGSSVTRHRGRRVHHVARSLTLHPAIARRYGFDGQTAFQTSALFHDGGSHRADAARIQHLGETIMTTPTTRSAMAGRSLAFGAVIACALFAAGSADAAGCPAGKMTEGARAPEMTKGRDVTDSELSAIDLSKEMVKLEHRRLRLRKLVIQPGGIVPWHSHGDRPAIIYIISGTVLEYASNCSVGIEHKAGDVTSEQNGVAHWWRNEGKTPVVLLSADIVHDQDDAHVM
jgi:quercetin dioxygenase-like cupin family protein